MSHGRGRRGNALLADKSRTRDTWPLIKYLWNYLQTAKKQLIIVSMIIMIYTLGATYQPILIQQALDILQLREDTRDFVYLISFFAILSLLVWIFQSISTWIMADISASLVDKIRIDAFDNLVRADMAYHHKNQSGNVTSRVISDSSEVSTGLQVFTSTATQLLTILATFIVLVTINYWFAIISLLAVPVAWGVAKFFGTVGKKRMLNTRQAYGHVSGKLAENLAGVSIAKAFNQETRVSQEIKELNDKSYGYMKQLGTVFILVMPSVQFVSTLLVFGILYVGGFLTTITTITVGTIYLGTIMVNRFLQPLIHLSNSYTQLQASLAALDRIVDILETEPAVHNAEDATELVVRQGEIEFEGIYFAYDNDLVLEDVSFGVPAGKKVALVGHTGAGKTTITSLLMRFYDPQHGAIRIDGQNIRNVTLESLHGSLSLVSQEPYLFADTVLENIRYGMLSASDEEIYDLCTLLGADQFIEALPQGYETILQESGKSLSAGQRQMITIARTMLSDPEILVLDEATSRLDAYSEALVQNAQRILFEGRTTLIIAHRLSTIRDVDKIVVLEQGKIIEEGSHEELMKNEGKYAELYNMYYAHQGVKPLITVVETTEGDVQTMDTDFINLVQSRIKFFNEMSPDIKVTFDASNSVAKVDLEHESSKLIRIIDGMMHQLSRMLKHMGGNKLSIRVQQSNGFFTVTSFSPTIKIPEKVRKMMSQGGSMGSRGVEEFSLKDHVEKLNGSFTTQTPFEDETSGFALIAEIPRKSQ